MVLNRPCAGTPKRPSGGHAAKAGFAEAERIKPYPRVEDLVVAVIRVGILRVTRLSTPN